MGGGETCVLDGKQQPSTSTHVLGGEERCHRPKTQPDDKAVVASSSPPAVVGKKGSPLLVRSRGTGTRKAQVQSLLLSRAM